MTEEPADSESQSPKESEVKEEALEQPPATASPATSRPSTPMSARLANKDTPTIPEESEEPPRNAFSSRSGTPLSEEGSLPKPPSAHASRQSSLASRHSSKAKRQSTVTRRPVPTDSPVFKPSEPEPVAKKSTEPELGPTHESAESGYADTPGSDDEQRESDAEAPQSRIYEDIYDYYGTRQTHPYSQLTRESVYYSTDSVGNAKPPLPTSADKDAESERSSIDEANKTMTDSEPPTPDEQVRLEHEIMDTFTSSDKRRSIDKGALGGYTHSRSTSATSRSSTIDESLDAEIAELYEGTTEFLDRPISVYQNVQPLHTRSTSDTSEIKDTTDVSTPKIGDTAAFADNLPTEPLESGINALAINTEPSGLPKLNFIAASPVTEEGEKPRWQPIEDDGDADVSSSTVVGKQDDTEDNEAKDTSGDSSIVKDLSLTGNMLENMDQSHDGGEAEKVTTRGTFSSSSEATHHAHNDSNTSALSMISDNHDIVPPEIPPTLSEVETDDQRDPSPPNVQQFTQISAKVKRPPPVDFSALLSGPTSEARLAQLVNFRQREAEYESGLSVWLQATYSVIEGNTEIYTTGLPPENEGRSVSMTRQMTHISSEHLSSTKEALEHFGEKSTKKARSLFAKGRRLVKS